MNFSKWGRAAMVPALALLAVAATDSSFDAGRYLQHIRYLASPELKGRATGSPELEKAARYIEDQFRDAGLHPPPGAKGFRQPFQVTTSAKLGRANRVEISAGGET